MGQEHAGDESGERLLKTAEVAARLGVHRDTVKHWLAAGVLPGIKLPGNAGWRLRARDLAQWLVAHEQEQRQTI